MDVGRPAEEKNVEAVANEEEAAEEAEEEAEEEEDIEEGSIEGFEGDCLEVSTSPSAWTPLERIS